MKHGAEKPGIITPGLPRPFKFQISNFRFETISDLKFEKHGSCAEDVTLTDIDRRVYTRHAMGLSPARIPDQRFRYGSGDVRAFPDAVAETPPFGHRIQRIPYFWRSTSGLPL
jgi:hypothetical protein